MCQVNHQDPAGCALQYVHACDLATYRLYSVVCHVHWGGVQHTVCGCSWGENYSEWPVFHRPAVPCGRPAARDEINAECTRKLSEFIYKKKKKRKRPEYTEGSANSSVLQDRRGKDEELESRLHSIYES